MNTYLKSGVAFALLTCLAAPTSSVAQKSKDTLRIAFLEATQSPDPYMDSKPENTFLGNAIWDTLITYDEAARQYSPLLAKSFKRIDDTTIEVELRDDVKWQDGEAFDADDVVHTFDWATAPETKLRNKADWEMLSAEKVGAHKVRIKSKFPMPNMLDIIAVRMFMFPEHVHKPLADKEAFGTKPVGTGMWRATQVDRNLGYIFLKNPNYKHGGKAKPASNIGRIDVIPVPDEGTQMAHFLRGDIHMLRNTPLEQAEEMAKNPQYAMTLAQSLSYLYMLFDAAGRSGIKPLQDIRVRKAMMMAVNGEEVYRIRTGKHPLPRGVIESMCWKVQEGCDYSLKPPAFDPAAAKKLLAEAGYADGFDIQITTFNSTKDMAEVVVGQLRKIGIRASVDAVTFVAYRKKQSDGKLNALANAWSAGSSADISSTINSFYDPGPRDYFQDPELQKLAKLGLTAVDPEKRKEAMRGLMDRTTEQAYAFPIAPIPLVFLHIADLKINELRYEAYGILPSDINWK
jgi:peptide/nickel transport system substrate-binding protein